MKWEKRLNLPPNFLCSYSLIPLALVGHFLQTHPAPCLSHKLAPTPFTTTMSDPEPPKAHPNDNVEILYKPYIKVRSDYESDTTPKQVKCAEELAFEKACPPPPASPSCVLTQTSELRRFGFCHSYLPVNHEALCYTTLDSRLLAKKLASLPYKY